MIQIFAGENLMIKKLFVLLFACNTLVTSQPTPPPNDYIALMAGSALHELAKAQLKEKQSQQPTKIAVLPTATPSVKYVHTMRVVILLAARHANVYLLKNNLTP